MPKPTHANFCPHCGAKPSTRRSSVAEAVFTCGERLRLPVNHGPIIASYTCPALGQIAKDLEGVLDDARKCIDSLRLSVEGAQVLREATAYPDNGTYMTLQRISARCLLTLADMGLIDRIENTNQIRATKWGRIVYQHREGQAHDR